MGIDPRRLWERFGRETDRSLRRAILLSLGSCRAEAMGDSHRERIAAELLDIFQHEPDAGIHSAAEWLLRRWGYADRLEQATATLAGSTPYDGKRWCVNRSGDTLAIVSGPVEYLMGSPWNEVFRHANEELHRQRIRRSFAIATKEVTFEQFHGLFPMHYPAGSEFQPEPNCPAGFVSWYQACKYCRWLSEQEGLSEEQMCYPPIDQIGPGMQLPRGFLERTGYRLPTEAEWEYACRAGAVTPRPYGFDPALMGEYGWHVENSKGRSWPVGLLKPNDFGFFDMLGNAAEWCHDDLALFIAGPLRAAIDDLAGPDLDEAVPRVVRGGAFSTDYIHTRCAQRRSEAPEVEYPDFGFRVARTVATPGLDVRWAGNDLTQTSEHRAQLTDSLGMSFALIPAGVFAMGSTADEIVSFAARQPPNFADAADQLQSEAPRHDVRISRPFYLGRNEVTMGQFRRFVEATGYRSEAERDHKPVEGLINGKWQVQPEGYSWRQPGYEQTDEHPVVNVTWNDAVEFCKWASENQGESYRLPTEAEWEYACRAGAATIWHHGNDGRELADYAWLHDNSGLVPHPVGRKLPNAWGLHDMLGNVVEWCGDIHEFDYYRHSPLVDPAGGTVESQGRTLRGGYCWSWPIQARPARRWGVSIADRGNGWGFRVARDVSPRSLVPLADRSQPRLIARYRLRGPEAPFAIRDVTGNVAVTPMSGMSPADLTVSGPGLNAGPYSFNVERVDTHESYPVAGRWLLPRWKLRFFSSPPPNGDPPALPDWQVISAGPVVEERSCDLVDFNWRFDSPEAVPADRLAIVATADIELDAGRYEIQAVSGGGLRFYIDDHPAIDSWSGDYKVDLIDAVLAAGRHSLRIEYYARGARPELRFTMRPLDSIEAIGKPCPTKAR